MRRGFALAAIVLALAGPAGALQPDEVLRDPALEARARAISSELRCVVCQNQSIDESDAPLARDLRLLVRERIVAGDQDGAVRDFVVRRYGEFVLLKPVFALHTALLWIGPLAILLLAMAGIAAARRRRLAPVRPLTPDEAAGIRRIEESDPTRP